MKHYLKIVPLSTELWLLSAGLYGLWVTLFYSIENYPAWNRCNGVLGNHIYLYLHISQQPKPNQMRQFAISKTVEQLKLKGHLKGSLPYLLLQNYSCHIVKHRLRLFQWLLCYRYSAVTNVSTSAAMHRRSHTCVTPNNKRITKLLNQERFSSSYRQIVHIPF